MTTARSTICVVPRERFSLALASLDALIAGLEKPFRLVYVDAGSPAPVRDSVLRRAIRHDFTLLRTEHYLSPNEARNLAFGHVDTEFVAFLDNDVFLSTGWLPELEQAADRHGAAVVAPVYLIARGRSLTPVVHVAGADNHVVVEDGRRRQRVRPHHEDGDPAEVVPLLEPQPTGLAEFHCFFARADAIAAVGPLDESLLSLNEHIDVSMRIRDRGGEIWLEPSVVVAYVVTPRLPWSSTAYYLLRWSRPWNEASIRRFHATWDIDADDPESARLLRHADYKRFQAYWPYRSLIGRIQARRGRHSRPLPDRVISPFVFRRETRRRARGGPPVVTHRATWDHG
jgi:GT2 family glycosyltransferase